jgi:hypothetical protein
VAGGAAVLVSVLGGMNRWTLALVSYNTAEPVENVISQWVLGRAVLAIATGAGAFFLVMAGDVFLQVAVGDRAFPRPSLARTAAVAAVIWGVFRGLGWLSDLVPGDRYELALWSLAGVDTSLPAVAVVSWGLAAAVIMVAAVVITSAAVYRYLFDRRGGVLLLAILMLVALSRSSSVWQWGFHLAEAVLVAVLIVFLVRTCGLDLAGFAVAVFWLETLGLGAELLSQPAAAFRVQGGVAVVLSLLLGGGLIMLARVRSPSRTPPANSPTIRFTTPPPGSASSASTPTA